MIIRYIDIYIYWNDMDMDSIIPCSNQPVHMKLSRLSFHRDSAKQLQAKDMERLPYKRSGTTYCSSVDQL